MRILIISILLALFLAGNASCAISGNEINDSINYYGKLHSFHAGIYEYRDGLGYNATLDTTGANWMITYWMPACCSWNVNYGGAVFAQAGATYFEWVPQYSNPFDKKAVDRVGLRKTFKSPSEQGDLSTQIYNSEHYNIKDEKTMRLREVLMDHSLWAMNELPGL